MKERLERIQQRINNAAHNAGRDPSEITLVGVSKTWPVTDLVTAYEAGVRHFGENRPEELAQKRPQLEAELGHPDDIVWHFIGTVQSRKSKHVAAHADYFHALDRVKIAQRLAHQRTAEQPPLPFLLEVNISGETSKAGFVCGNWEQDSQQQDALVAAINEIQTLPHLQLQGLMTMAPWGSTETENRLVFQRTRELAAWLNETLDGLHLSDLSMGMSGDFEAAIAEGATHVRVGSAIFGSRY